MGLDLLDVIVAAELRPRLEPFFKNEHHRQEPGEIDRQLTRTIFEWRKRALLGNDHEDQDWALISLQN